jgi:hypothetical protein
LKNLTIFVGYQRLGAGRRLNSVVVLCEEFVPLLGGLCLQRNIQ